MKRLIGLLMLICCLPALCNAQVKELMSMIDKNEFENVLTYVQQAYGEDENNTDRAFVLYNYYINANNPSRDSLVAFSYLIQYNAQSNKKIDGEPIAKSLLSVLYSYKDVDKLDKYISLTQQYESLNKEARRIRDRLAYEQAVKSNDIAMYENFVTKYPDAVQSDDARMWINEHKIDNLIKNENIEELKTFASSTTSTTYKKKALQEIDRLSFKLALKDNTIDSYVNYMKEFPQGAYLNMAKTNIDKLQYRQYVQAGSITDMIYYLNTHSSDDKNYNEILNRLSLLAMQHYSVAAMQKVYSLTSDDKLLERFAKKYISDLKLQSIDNLLSAFPSLEQTDYVIAAKEQATKIDALLNKQKLTTEDYNKNKSLLKSLKPTAAKELFSRFVELSSSLPEKKKLKFNLDTDSDYIQFKNAEKTELKYVLAEKPAGYKLPKDIPQIEEVGLLGTDAMITSDKTVIMFSKADTDGYDYYEGTPNRDIYVCLYENSHWSKPFVLSDNINSRVDDCCPVLSEDKKTLWFSSSRTLNFGGLDIYVSFREDTSDWDNWSTPILLGEDFNTADNDYVVDVKNNFVVITQDADFKEENNIYLEGNIADNFISGKIQTKSIKTDGTTLQILDAKTLKTLNTVTVGGDGLYAFVKPDKAFKTVCKKNRCFSFVNTEPILYSFDTILTKQEIITFDSPFDDNGTLTVAGKKNLEILANTFAAYNQSNTAILTIGVHAVNGLGKMTHKELSDKQAIQISDVLTKHGLDKDSFIVTGYGRENIMQGWNDKNSIDVGVIKK